MNETARAQAKNEIAKREHQNVMMADRIANFILPLSVQVRYERQMKRNEKRAKILKEALGVDLLEKFYNK